jgi:hypothetical protein
VGTEASSNAASDGRALGHGPLRLSER